MTDREILDLLFARSERALEALEEKYGALCRRIAYNIVGDARDAEECAADTALAVWNTVPPKEPDPLSPYVGRIARNLALDRYRYNRAGRRYAGGDAVLAELAEIVLGADSAESEAETSALTDALNRFLRAERAPDRRMFVRRYWYGDSVESVARDAGVTPNAAAVRLCRMRERLRRYLLQEGFAL